MKTIDTTSIIDKFHEDLVTTASLDDIESLRRVYLGKNSPLKQAMKSLRDIQEGERASVASNLNEAVKLITEKLDSLEKQKERSALEDRLQAEWQDLSMPGIVTKRGGRHPVTEIDEICMSVLRRLGFDLVDGPEVESAYFTFDALNIPEHHPARDMQDTFWLSDTMVLRTHTTSIQARVLQSQPQLPIKIASNGRVYRNEAIDATHLAMFHQFEGLWVDKGLTFAHLKGILSFIARELFGNHPIRFKPKFYPYTEPSAGVDMQCSKCFGNGCIACHDAGWVTILGCGMVHPKVFMEFGYDPNEVTGIAFGLGTARMACQKAGVDSLRKLYQADIRILETIHRRSSV